jgi:hypothetical protein
MNSKVDWYNYLVKEKSDSSYWPQLLQARIDREQQWLASGVTDFKEMNNISWDIFGRSQDSGQLKVALGWMEQVYKNSKDPDMMDTYACVAYRLGKSDEALQAEQQALRFWIDNRKHGTMTYMIRTMLVIREMCAGKQIWFEKEIRE